jgi:hypothetical protein
MSGSNDRFTNWASARASGGESSKVTLTGFKRGGHAFHFAFDTCDMPDRLFTGTPAMMQTYQF